MARRLVLFAHWDAEARIRTYVLRHLKALRATGAEIDFLSTSPLPASEQKKLMPYCWRVTILENIGYDFTMWRHALEQVDPKSWDHVLLVNSSVLGPLFPLDPILDRMECKDCDFWGMTASPEAVPHLQSYFLSFKSSLLREDRFRQFWASVLPYSDKRNVVASYEVGLTTWLREGGFDGHVAFPLPAKPISRWESLKIGRLFHSKVRHDRNPILSYPDLLIHAGLPYVKMDLIRNNSQKLRLDRIRALLEAEGWDPDALG